MMGELYTEVSVVFENVRFQRATNIPKDGNLEFIIMIQKGSGNFEVSNNNLLWCFMSNLLKRANVDLIPICFFVQLDILLDVS